MTRKKKPSAQQVPQQVTDDAGWTHVIKGPKSNLALTSSLPFHPSEASLTTEDYAKKFHASIVPQWQESSCWQSLKSLFEQDILTSEHITITKCICLGLGSPTAYENSSSQLAALIAILEVLSIKHNIHEVIFQDPAFNHQDRTFLRSLGYTVLKNPEALSKIDSNTFLFAPHLEVGVLATALEDSVPPLCIANDITHYIDGLLRPHAEEEKANSPDIFERYSRHTVSKAMSGWDGMMWAFGTNVYWLKSTSD